MTNTTDVEPDPMAEPGRIPRITPEDVLEVFDDRDDQAEPLTAPEVADALDCSRRTALNKLHTLAEDGEVRSKKVGGRSKVWWLPLPDRSPATAPEASRPEEPGQDGRESGTTDATGDTPGEQRTGTRADHRALVDDLDLEGNGSTLEARREAIVSILDTLREEGSAQKSDLLAGVDVDHEYDDDDSFWANLRRQNVLDELAVVETPGQGGRIYHYHFEED